MTSIKVEGVKWHTNTPSLFFHDNVAVHYDGAWWRITTRDNGCSGGSWKGRDGAMQYTKAYLLEAA